MSLFMGTGTASRMMARRTSNSGMGREWWSLHFSVGRSLSTSPLRDPATLKTLSFGVHRVPFGNDFPVDMRS